jgi:hypothetical protein
MGAGMGVVDADKGVEVLVEDTVKVTLKVVGTTVVNGTF